MQNQPQPEVFYSTHPVQPAPPAQLLPPFVSIAQLVEAQASRIPWWAWLVGGYVLSEYLRRRKSG